jgi:putative nucleotidyltransferase with HDIG domain
MTEHASSAVSHETGVRTDVNALIDGLPGLPCVVHELLALARKEYLTATDFRRVICKDQALVARLLRVANSSACGRSRGINTIPEAVVLIGLDNMKTIVYAVSSEGLLRRSFRVYDYHEKGFWLHAMGVAVTTRLLIEAARSRRVHAEAAFVAGLVHDVGKLIIDDLLDPAAGPRVVEAAAERAAAGLDHAELGAAILAGWNIPEPIVASARWHHDPARAGDRAEGALAVAMADAICNVWGVGVAPFLDLGEEFDAGPFAGTLATLDIPHGRLPGILDAARQKLVTLEDIFGEE